MAESALEQQDSSGSTEVNMHADILSAVYDGLTVHRRADGAIGLGLDIGEKTLKRSRPPQMSEEQARLFRYWSNGAAGLGAIMIGVTYMAGLEGWAAAGFSAAFGASAAATYGLGRMPRIQAKAHKEAQEDLRRKMTYVPSHNLSVGMDGLPQEFGFEGRPTDTGSLVAVLQRLQTAHLSSKESANHAAQHPDTINPAMILRGAVVNLSAADRPAFLHRAFDHIEDVSRLTNSLHNHAPLAATADGREGLRFQTAKLLAHLGNTAAHFIDLKAAEISPRIAELVDAADDASLRAGLLEAQSAITEPGLSADRYHFVTQNWGDAGKS